MKSSIKNILPILAVLLFFLNNSVLSQDVTVAKLNDLDFGEVFVGFNADVPFADVRAAKFHIRYNGSGWFVFVNIRFTLPSNLTNGAYNIPITFDNAHTARSYNDQPAGATTFNPTALTAVLMSGMFAGWRDVYIWIGGSITTNSSLIPGVYQGTIILTVEY